MKKILLSILSLFVAALASPPRAEVAVEGFSASGMPGQRVFLQLIFDYGESFNLIAEQYKFTFPPSPPFPGDTVRFVKDASTIDLFGQVRTFDQYKAFLAGGAGVAVGDNLDPKFYSFAFVAAGEPQERRDTVQMRVAFDILPSALPGTYPVAVTGLLYDETECCELPTSLQNLSVIVQPNALPIPEPKIALMLLPGLALIVLYARLRGARRKRPMDGRIDC